MNIKIEPGAKVQITDKPIINVFGDVVQHKEEHIHFDAKSNSYSNAEEAEVVEEIKDNNSSQRDGEQPMEAIDPAVVFVERVKEIMKKAEKDNGKQKQNNSRSYTTTYIYYVDGKGFCKVMDELLTNYKYVIKDYLKGATAETACSIKYVCPFIGNVLDTHLYSAAKMPKNEFKKVMQTIYGKGTSAVSKMSDKNPSNEAEVLYKTAKEIMEKHKNG